MSIKNIIDGSFSADGAIDFETLDISVPFQGNHVDFHFTKMGNIASISMSSGLIASTVGTFDIPMNYPQLAPYIPSSDFSSEFQLRANGTFTWASFTWNTEQDLFHFTIQVNPLNLMQFTNQEQIKYNII